MMRHMDEPLVLPDEVWSHVSLDPEIKFFSGRRHRLGDSAPPIPSSWVTAPDDAVTISDDDTQKPTDDDDAQKPTDDDNSQRPADDDNFENPMDDDNGIKPTDDDNTQKPTDDDNAQKPTDDDNAHKPTSLDISQSIEMLESMEDLAVVIHAAIVQAKGNRYAQVLVKDAMGLLKSLSESIKFLRDTITNSPGTVSHTTAASAINMSKTLHKAWGSLQPIFSKMILNTPPTQTAPSHLSDNDDDILLQPADAQTNDDDILVTQPDVRPIDFPIVVEPPVAKKRRKSKK